MTDLVEDREAVVEEVVEHLVEQPAGAAREEVVAKLLAVVAALEEPRQRAQLDRRQRLRRKLQLGHLQLAVDVVVHHPDHAGLLHVRVPAHPVGRGLDQDAAEPDEEKGVKLAYGDGKRFVQVGSCAEYDWTGMGDAPAKRYGQAKQGGH